MSKVTTEDLRLLLDNLISYIQNTTRKEEDKSYIYFKTRSHAYGLTARREPTPEGEIRFLISLFKIEL